MTITVGEVIRKLEEYDARTAVVLPLYSGHEGIGANGAENVADLERLLPKTSMLNRDGKATEVVMINIEEDDYMPDDMAQLTMNTFKENMARHDSLDYIYADVSKPEKPEAEVRYYNVVLMSGDVVVAKSVGLEIDPEKTTMVEIDRKDEKLSGLITPEKRVVKERSYYEAGEIETAYKIVKATEVK